MENIKAQLSRLNESVDNLEAVFSSTLNKQEARCIKIQLELEQYKARCRELEKRMEETASNLDTVLKKLENIVS